MKIKSIKLMDGVMPVNDHIVNYSSEAEFRKHMLFRVESLTDSIEYHTGQLLDRAEVDALCHSRDWKVTIVSAK